MEESVAEHFEGNRCVNCMCHSTENLYSYASTNLLRVADGWAHQLQDAEEFGRLQV